VTIIETETLHFCQGRRVCCASGPRSVNIYNLMACVLLSIALTLILTGQASADIYRTVSDEGVVTFTNTPSDRRAEVVVKEAKQPKAQAKAKNVSTAAKQEFHSLAEAKARKHDVDPKLVKAVIRAESNWNPWAVSPKGALGLMQLMPSTARDMGVVDPFSPEENIDGGVRYLRYLLDKFNGNLTLSLAAYNAGPGLVERSRTVPAIPETRTYVRRVIDDYSGMGGTVGAAEQGAKAKERDNRIVRVIMENGTILFTNLHPASGRIAR